MIYPYNKNMIITTSDPTVSAVVNVAIIFVLGFFLLFLVNAMRNESRYYMVYLASYFTVVLGYILAYTLRKVPKDKRNSEFRLVNFMLIYTIFLMQSLAVVFYFTLNNSIASSVSYQPPMDYYNSRLIR